MTFQKGHKLGVGNKYKLGISPWNKGKRMSEKARQNMSTAAIGRKASEETKKKMSEQRTDRKHNLWKGELASYSAKHHWISRKLGKPTVCEHCNKQDLKGRQIHWANISGEYRRDTTDWIRLCTRCHITFDRRNTTLQANKAWETKRKYATVQN